MKNRHGFTHTGVTLMNSADTRRSYFTCESYHVTYNTKDPDDNDDIYVNESLVNSLDSKCTHFENKSTHFEEKTHVYQQQRERNRYLKWTAVEAAAANKYRDYGEGITYQDILKRFPELGKTDGQAQDVLRNYKNKRKLYTSHRTKPQQYF